MTAVAGSIESVSIRNRLFAVAADAESNYKLGGFENEVAANGNGTARLLKTRVPLSLDGLAVEIEDGRADMEFLQEVADGQDFVPFAVTFASGAVWQGSVQITDELQGSTQSALATITAMGPGALTQQS